MQIGAGTVRKIVTKKNVVVSPKGRFRAIGYVIIALNAMKHMALLHDDANECLISQLPNDAALRRTLVAPHLFVAESVAYELSLLQRIFITFDRPTASVISRIIFIIIILAIMLGVILFVLAGTPDYSRSPKYCEQPTCDHDPALCPNTTICEPINPPFFDTIDMVCVIIFTVDYGIRLLTCWCVPPPLAGVTSDLASDMGHAEQVVRYFLKPSNLIDIAAILPSYVEVGLVAASGGQSSSSSSFVRVLRLARLLRILKVGKGSEIMYVLFKCLQESAPAISIALFIVSLGTIAFASVFQMVEQGDYVVSREYPDGAYLRDDVFGTGRERSPFTSIPIAIYYTIVTQTTVGYGDLYPTSTGGRALATTLAHIGILVLALPISVIGSNFSVEFEKYAKKKALEARGCIVDDAVVFYKDVVRDIQARKLMARQRLTGPLPEKKDSAASTKEAWSTAHRTRAPGAALRELEERGDFVTAGTPLQTFTKLDVIIAKMRVAVAHRKGIEVKYKQPLGTSKSFNSRRHSQTRKKMKKLPCVAPRLYRFFDESVQVGCNYKVCCTLS
jgi:hypothetical protein